MLKGITETRWREMRKYCDRAFEIWIDNPQKDDASSLAETLVQAAEEILHERTHGERATTAGAS